MSDLLTPALPAGHRCYKFAGPGAKASAPLQSHGSELVTWIMNRQELTAASSIGLLYLIRMLGLFMVLPVLPLAAQEVPGATPLLIGLALGIYGLSQAFLQIPLGLLSDRFGRKPVIVGGLLVFVTGSLVAGFSDDVYGLIIGRFLQGCGAIASTLLALMSDLTRVDQRSKSMAIIGISIAGSFGLALVLGPWVESVAGLSGIFFLTGVLGVAGLLCLLVLVPTPDVQTFNPDSSVQQGRLQGVMRDLALWRLNISIFFLHFLLVSAFSVFPLLFEETGQISRDQHALYYLSLLLGSFVLMTPFMWLSDKLPDIRPVLMASVSLSLVSFVLLSADHSYWFVIAAVTLFFMSFNLLEVILPAQLSRTAGAGLRGTAMGVYTTWQFLGIFAGGVVSGWILDAADINTVVTVNAVIVAVWLIICFSFPSLGAISSRTVELNGSGQARIPQERKDALLSVDGVIEVASVDSDRLAYLKVNEEVLDDQALKKVVEQLNQTSLSTDK